ncbi:K(+) efflux antiporter 2, chloroplastic [Sesamum alatum]|uniref:K(+) efflux antiporter 2, chloroplastic n=1 Tax=Sesamum alatum TaxID=300844 RepID=A0AAE1XV70_9LAMI|nr:K(+) efflux antiporter 2, chloroplastic [Sesamum alatum]
MALHYLQLLLFSRYCRSVVRAHHVTGELHFLYYSSRQSSSWMLCCWVGPYGLGDSCGCWVPCSHYAAGLAGPASIVIGNGLALSSTVVVLQVLQERGESTSRHGRATFSVLLFQDLAVVVLLILILHISPSSPKEGSVQAFLLR